jgi:ABC-2 type transport system permease protein
LASATPSDRSRLSVARDAHQERWVLSVLELRKQYGATVAVDGLSFDVGRNEIVGLLGPNGAGKTTTINMILGVLEGVTMAFFEDVWSRNFLNIFATPLSLPEYVGGLVLSSIATSSVGLIVMLVVAGAAFGLSLLVYGVMLVPFLLVLFLFGIALGIFGSAVVLRLGPAAEWFVWPIPAVVSPFAGVFYPLSTLPEWMRFIARLLPPSYVFEGMRAIVSGGAFSATALLWGVGLAVLYILLACWFFTRVYRYAVRTGLIARYSAESVS